MVINYNDAVLIDDFKNRKIKAKKIFIIKEISKNVAYDFIKEYHYLSDAKFFSKYNYGLFINNTLIGVATYSNPQGISSLKSWFDYDNSNQSILELSRLCILPILNGSNATSFLLSNSMNMLNKNKNIKGVITLADSTRHVGSIYQVCNFKYYGLTNKKTDFYTEDNKINPRGKTHNVKGVWLPRNRKHRYCYLFDKNIKVNLIEEEKPSKSTLEYFDCCNNSNIVYDKRYNIEYTCPKCTGELKIINNSL